jgi:hypothetical protein
VSHAAGGTWLAWLEQSAPAVAMRQWLWLYPAVEIAHIAGIVLLAGSAAMFDLRLLGFSRGLPVGAMARHLLPWARVGLLVLLPTGFLMFIAHATEFGTSPVFLLKMTLVATGAANAAVFHRWPFRSVSRWDVDRPAPVPARLAAVFSLATWTGAISCGRLLAYF